MACSADNYVRGKVLGKGSFGTAVLVTDKRDGKSYVMKEIDISRMPAAERESSKQEAQLLMALKHPNIVKCVECFTSANKLCIVMEWCSEGDLYGILQKRKNEQLPEDTILDWFVQICLGLKHVHDRKILHRDIKSQNVFVTSGGILRLGDFGVSKVLASTWQLAGTAVGTPYYLSPEICQNKKYNQKSDIWSLGCVLYELTTLKQAFEAPNMRALIQKVIKASYPPVPATRSKELRDLIAKIFTLDWQKRPSINEVLALPVMKARIEKFLSSTMQMHEFSHTIIHGKPQPGQLVVQSASGSADARPGSRSGSTDQARPSSSAGPKAVAVAPGARPPTSGGDKPPATPPRPGSRPSPSASPAPAPRPGGGAPASRPAAAAPSAPGGGAPKQVPSADRPGSVQRAAGAPVPGARPGSAAVEAGSGGKGGSSDPRKSKEEAALVAAKQKEEEIRKKLERDMSALGAQRDMERLRLLEAQRKRVEQEGAQGKSKIDAQKDAWDKQQAVAAAAAAAAGAKRPVTPLQHGGQAAMAQKPAMGGANGPAAVAERYERKKNALEAERLAREAEIAEFQKRNFKEVREAAQRNRARMIGDIFGAGRAVTPRPGAPAAAAGADERRRLSDGAAAAAAAADDSDLVAMAMDMQRVMGGGDDKVHHGMESDEDDGEDEGAQVLSGKIVVNGEVVQLPVRESDSLGVKVEALRVFLEKRLGAGVFLKVYKRLESMSAADAGKAEAELLAALGPERGVYVQLVRRLILAEEQWAQEGNK